MNFSKYPSVIEYLQKEGLTVKSASSSLFSTNIVATLPIGNKQLTCTLSYSSFMRSLSVDIVFPYSPADKSLEAEYDRRFPNEKGMIGRSTPVFEQAIIDYMRGQGTTGNLVEFRNHRTEVHIALSKGSDYKKEQGFLDALKKASFELRKGALHEDVLTHMFAY
ncbi:MAG: hypothetical protein SPL80_05090 [Bacilli bacterium]|nr:hypothetical protein [Bacilli bacterium]